MERLLETRMHCLKLQGQRLAARDFDRQVADFQIRVAVLNGFTAPGIPVTESRRTNLSGERGSPSLNRFVQQNPFHSLLLKGNELWICKFTIFNLG